MGFFDSVWDGVKSVGNSLNPVEKIKNFKDDPLMGAMDMFLTYNPKTAGISAAMNFAQGALGGSDDEKPKDDHIGNMAAGLGTGAGESDGSGGGGNQIPANPSEGSLGRPIALEQDPVLDQPVDNSNNFIF